MPRPGTAPAWATNTNYSTGPVGVIGTPTKVAPSGGTIADGYLPGDEPGAQNYNYEVNLLCQWVAWLAAGILDGNWEFTGNVQIDGTLLINSDLTMGANKNVSVSGTGQYKRPAQIRVISVYAGKAFGSSTFPPVGSSFSDAWRGQANADALRIPVTVNQGETITKIDVKMYGDTGGVLAATLYKQNDPFSSASPCSETINSTASATDQTLSIAHQSGGVIPLAEAVDGTAWYFVHIVQTGASSTPGSSGPAVNVALVTTTVP